MEITRINKKGGMQLAIMLLVIGAIVLTALAMFTFYTKQKTLSEKIYVNDMLEDVYSNEEVINFYVDRAMENSVKINSSWSDDQIRNAFVQNMLGNLSLYKNSGGFFMMPELGQVERQITLENVRYDTTNKKISIAFEIKLNKTIELQGGNYSAGYVYDRSFEKILAGKGLVLAPATSLELAKNVEVPISLNREPHSLTLTHIKDGSATILIKSSPITITLAVGETKKVDINGDGIEDIMITLNSLDSNSNVAHVTIKGISSDSKFTPKTPIEPAQGEYALGSNMHILLDGVDTKYSLAASWSQGGAYLLGWTIKRYIPEYDEYYPASFGCCLAVGWIDASDGKISLSYSGDAVAVGLPNYYFDVDTFKRKMLSDKFNVENVFIKIGDPKPIPPKIEPALGNYTLASNKHNILLEGVDTKYSLAASWSDGGGYLLGWTIKRYIPEYDEYYPDSDMGSIVAGWIDASTGEIALSYQGDAVAKGLSNYYFDVNTWTFIKINRG